MEKHHFWCVKKRTLLAIAGCVWLIAGFNFARLGILAYIGLEKVTFLHILLSLAVFCAFGFMFFRMSLKHSRRIKGYESDRLPFRHFFDLKAYIIMVVMMGGGIWLRSSGIAPEVFIVFFYTGLACALALAGMFFRIIFSRYKPEQAEN